MKDERSDVGDSRCVRQQPHHRRMQKLMDKHNHLLIWSYLGAGKTHQLIGRVLFELGRNPDLRIAIFSNSMKLSTKITSTIADYIDGRGRVRLQEVFPHLRRGVGRWNTTELTVHRSPNVPIKDPSVQCLPVRTGAAQGARIDIAILDDVYTAEEFRSDAQSEHLQEWYEKTISGRANKIWMIGNVFSPDDFMHRLEKSKNVWYGERFPLLDQNGICTWPEMYTPERIAEVRSIMSEEEFSRMYLCIPRDDAAALWKRTWIDKALEKGNGLEMLSSTQSLVRLPAGASVITGVDLGHRPKKTSDATVLFTYMEMPNGDRYLLEIQTGRWAGPDILDRLVGSEDGKVLGVHQRFGSIIHVENVAAQQFILDFSKRRSAAKVVEFQTDRRKHDAQFGVEGLAVEMRNGKWAFPNDDGKCHPEVQALINEMLYYDPHAHTGDRLMAMWIGVEGTRREKLRMQTGHIKRRL